MRLLIDENVPKSVADFFRERGHEVFLVKDVLLPGTPDEVVGRLGVDMEAVLVSWDKDFKRIARRIPKGHRGEARKLSRISFECDETRGRAVAEKYIGHIEMHHQWAVSHGPVRILVVVQEHAIRLG